MCGIIGLIFKNDCGNISNNKENLYEKYTQYLLNSLKQLVRRGEDGYGISFNNECIYFKSEKELREYIQHNLTKNLKNLEDDSIVIYIHILHAIQGRVYQPIYNDKINSTLAFNGEIYNFEELNKKLSISTISDSTALFEFLNSFDSSYLYNNFEYVINELDADFAFAYQRENNLFLCRDYLGIKPLWYEFDEKNQCLRFSSQRKTLSKNSVELNPRSYICFDIKNFNLTINERIENYDINRVQEIKYEVAKKEVFLKLNDAVKKRITFSNKKKIGILFSGGVDSTVLALILQRYNIDFTCYNAELISPTLGRAEDSIYSEKIAQVHNLDLVIKKVSQDKLEELIIKVISIIESTDYIKVSVALPFLAACEEAKKDDVEIMFSGLGSEEIFAGYRRHRQVDDVNLECLNGLHLLHIRDLYRDDVITMSQTQELRVPFLDSELVKYSLPLSPFFKLDIEKVQLLKDQVYKKPHLNTKIRSKIILRDIAIEYLNLNEEFANRQKKAAQYGSKFDKGIVRLAKNRNLSKQDYLNKLAEENNLYVFN